MTYEEWLERVKDGENAILRARGIQTFMPLRNKSSFDNEETRPVVRQPGLRTLPVSHGIFQSVCEAFQVHTSVIKTIARSDLPSFNWEKINMGEEAYGEFQLRSIEISSNTYTSL